MNMPPTDLAPPSFRPLAVGALYSGIERGLAADTLAARALGGAAYTVCTSLVSAGRGRVTDVLEVPSDSVKAQLEHVLETTAPTSARLGILGSHQSATAVFKMLRETLQGPVMLDVTLSGPSGEDVVGPQGLDAIVEGFSAVDLVTMRRLDAERVAGQEIKQLSEAQVAAQRIHKQGAGKTLIRCGQLEEASSTSNEDAGNMNVDLYYDGDDFSLFEAPHLSVSSIHGSSSAFAISALHKKSERKEITWSKAIQKAKIFTVEALRSSVENNVSALDYRWRS